MNKKILLGIFIVITIILTVGIIFVYLDGKQVAKFQEDYKIEQQKKEEIRLKNKYQNITYTQDGDIDTSDWQIYRNEEFGFEVKHPHGWVYDEENTDTEVAKSEYFLSSVLFAEEWCAREFEDSLTEDCRERAFMGVYKSDMYITEDVLNSNKCEAGPIPSLRFADNLSNEIVSCSDCNDDNCHIFYKRHMFKFDNLDFVLRTDNRNNGANIKPYLDWTTKDKPTKYFQYREPENLDVLIKIEEEILKSFQFTKE